MFGLFAHLKKGRIGLGGAAPRKKKPVRTQADGKGGRHGEGVPASRPLANQERSFQVSLWMMLPSLYDQVIVS
jgi:hypothetical protein